jgi:hypothetical protein
MEGSAASDLKGGYWLSDDGDCLYIPSVGEHAPLIALSKYYKEMNLYDPETNDWVLQTLPDFRDKPKGQRWEFWEYYATYLIMRRWHLIWEGTIYSRWEVPLLANLIQLEPEIAESLKWDAQAKVIYKFIESDEKGSSLLWGHFLDPCNAATATQKVQASFKLPPAVDNESLLTYPGTNSDIACSDLWSFVSALFH